VYVFIALYRWLGEDPARRAARQHASAEVP
jgi:hypothetical protein